MHALYRCCQARKPTCVEQNERMSPTSGRLLVDDLSRCCCSCTKDFYSALHASSLLSLVHLFSKNPSKSLLNSWKEATSSPPIKIAGQKLLIPCPMSDPEAPVDSKQFKVLRDFTKRRRSRRNAVGRIWLPTLSSAVIRRVSERSFSHQLQGIPNALALRIPSIVLQLATKKPS